MLRSRAFRQAESMLSTPSERIKLSRSPPTTGFSEAGDVHDATDSRRVLGLRRSSSYSNRRHCWKRKSAKATLLFTILLWLGLVTFWLLNARQSGLRSLPSRLVEHSPFRRRTPPPLHELKRQDPKKLPKSAKKARPMVGRKTLLDLIQDEPEHDGSGVKHDIVNLRWPPLVTAIPEVRPSAEALMSGLTSRSVDAQFCHGGPHCRFLFPLWIGEQESRGRMHLMQILRLAVALNRTLVLPNVSKSRLGGCGKWAFDAYYDVPDFARSVQALWNGLPDGMISMDDFKTWVDMRPDKPITQMMFMDENSTVVAQDVSMATLILSEDALDVRVDSDTLDHEDLRLKNARCLRSKFQRLDLEKRYPISMRLASGDPPGAVVPGVHLADVLQREDILLASTLRDVQELPTLQDVLSPNGSLQPSQQSPDEADVLLLHWDLRRFPFTSSASTDHLDYSPNIHKLAGRLTKPYEPYVAVHWRMETVPPALLPDCAEALIDTLSVLLADPTLSQDIRSVWLATDLPWTGSADSSLAPAQRSNTFRNVTSQHTEAVEIVRSAFDGDGPLSGWKLTGLTQEMRRVRAELAASGEEFVLEDDDENGLLWEDSGVWGILDKMAAMESALFVSGARGCGRVR
ncbi:hypothetical protein EIP86_004837 [Pleurotus ostreatoroseus]|nr:hypothetical protein EIP86_004837 [Pleurotus ostreatoroseus]